MKECITHHHACDCREELHKNEIAELQSTIDELRAENERLRNPKCTCDKCTGGNLDALYEEDSEDA